MTSSKSTIPATPISCNYHQTACNHHILVTDHAYTCTPCNFFLHPSCSKFPPWITHRLTFVTAPVYLGGVVRCDACDQLGKGFSYQCQICKFDLHVMCSSKPLTAAQPLHPHPLVLTFSPPNGDKMGLSCDVCRQVGFRNQWLYRCVSCDFDVHLHCATEPPVSNHHHSFPGAAPVSQNPNQFMGPVAAQPLTHSMSTGQVQGFWQPPQAPAAGCPQSYQHPPQPPVSNHHYSFTGGGSRQSEPESVHGPGGRAATYS